MLNILCFFQPIITQELISTHPFYMTQKPFDQPQQIQASLDNENDDMLLPSVQCNVWYIDGLTQDCGISIANTLEIPQSWVKPLACTCGQWAI